MSSRRLAVSIDGRVKNAVGYQVSDGGKSKPVVTAYVAVDGVVRQYYPAEGVTASRIALSTTPITVKKWTINPVVAIAAIEFDKSAGYYSYNNHPDANLLEQYINPPLVDTVDDDLFLIRVDQTSSNGATITGTLAAWIELNQASLTWSLDQSIVGQLSETANITIAENDGLGAPISGTEVVKPVTFVSGSVSGGTKVVWSDTQRDLETIKQGEEATCEIVFNTDGSMVGYADSGAFTEDWHVDAPNAVLVPDDPPEFIINCTVVSGDVPTGGTVDADLPMESLRSWKLTALVGEDKSNVLDVTIADAAQSVTKRITMHPQYVEPPIPSPEPLTDWEFTDEPWRGAIDEFTLMTIRCKPDGTFEGSIENNQSPAPDTPENPLQVEIWMPGGADPADYEVMFEAIGVNVGSDAINTFISTDTERVWLIEYATLAATRTRSFPLSIKVIDGEPEVKTIYMTVYAGTGGQPS